MPVSEGRIRHYTGKTFVAFLDISGFKEMMKIKEKAESALGRFYSTIYSVGRNFRDLDDRDALLEVNAIVVSDCSVIFSRNSNPRDTEAFIVDKINGLRSILTFIRRVNKQLIISENRDRGPIMTTCSIAYGDFKYEDRIGLIRVRKNYFLGPPYMKAFLDIEEGRPKLRPGECRLLEEHLDLPENILEHSPFSLLEPTDKYYYFHWMLNSLADLERFKREYRDISQGLYTRLASLIQGYTSGVGNP